MNTEADLKRASEIAEHLAFREAARDKLKVMADFRMKAWKGAFGDPTQPTGKSWEPKLWISAQAITAWLSTHHIINTKPLKVKIYPHPFPTSFATSHKQRLAFTPQRPPLIWADLCDWASFSKHVGIGPAGFPRLHATTHSAPLYYTAKHLQ